MGSRTRVYLLLTGMGLLALGIDRFYLGSTAPQATQAGEAGDTLESAEDADFVSASGRSRQPSPSATPLGVPQLHFPRNLPVYDPSSEMRDIFASEPAAGDGRPENARNQTATATPPNAIGRDEFPSKHQVGAIMIQERLRIAVIDGRWMRVGEILDGCELTRIEGDFAVFQCHDGEAILSPNRNRKRLAD